MSRAPLCGGRERFPFPVFHGRQTEWVCRIYPNTVVVDKDITEYHRFYFFSGQLIRTVFIELFLLQGGKKAFHPCVIKAMTDSAQALLHFVDIQYFAEVLTCILTASITVQDHSGQIRILVVQLLLRLLLPW